MKCPNCGYRNHDSSKYCLACGFTFVNEDAPMPTGSSSSMGFPDKIRDDEEASEAEMVISDRYRIIKKLASGGMGRVYLTLDTKTNRRVVAKKMFNIASTDEEQDYLEKRFQEEARLLFSLQHKALPRVSDYFLYDNSFYIIMEYVQGLNLKQYLEKKSAHRICIEECIDFLAKSLEILAFLHNQHPPVIHRDVKPGNIMINQKGEVVLVDFGLARSLELNQGATARVGTYGFASPEHYTGKFRLSSDLYGLGATFHYLLSGEDPRKRPPFEYPPLTKYRDDMPPDLQKVFDKMVAPDPKDRYLRAEDALKDLREIISKSNKKAEEAASQSRPVTPSRRKRGSAAKRTAEKAATAPPDPKPAKKIQEEATRPESAKPPPEESQKKEVAEKPATPPVVENKTDEKQQKMPSPTPVAPKEENKTEIPVQEESFRDFEDEFDWEGESRKSRWWIVVLAILTALVICLVLARVFFPESFIKKPSSPANGTKLVMPLKESKPRQIITDYIYFVPHHKN